MNAKNIFLSACLLVMLGGGCYSEYAVTTPQLAKCQYAEGGSDIVETVFIKNRGWYLFRSIPIGCGNDDCRDGEAPFVLFQDRCTDEVLLNRFNRHVAKKGARAVGVALVNGEKVTITIPGLSVPLVLPYVICTRSVQVSGTLVKDRNPSEVSK